MSTLNMDDSADRREVLRRMLTIREFDSTAGDHFADGEIPGFVHLYIGEEAVAVGACAAIEDDDYITSTHRGHGHCIAKGLDPDRMMAELFGKTDGYCNGKGGSMHIADVDANMLGANGIVGAGPPLATGAALTNDLQDDDRIALSFLGDGAVAQGQVHEAINLASTWDLPAVFLVENNQYGEGTSIHDQHNVETLSETAEAYDIPGFTVDGMDVTAVYEAVEAARERAIEGEGPTFIEAETYRYRGHFEGDPQEYRTAEELDQWKARDPIEAFRERLADTDDLSESEFDSMQSDVEQTIEDAVAFAEDSDYPDPEAAYEDVFDVRPPEISRFADRTATDGGKQR